MLTLIFVLVELMAVTMGDIVFTQPAVGTIWTVGQQATIQWQSTTASPLPHDPLTINLMYGSFSFPEYVGVIISSQDASRVRVSVPQALPTGNQYSLTANGTSSALFSIVNPNLKAGAPIPTNLTLAVDSTVASSSGGVRCGWEWIGMVGGVYSSILAIS